MFWPVIITAALLPSGSAQEPERTSAEPDTSPLVHEAVLGAPPSEVWKVWSTGEGFKLLGVAKAEVDLRIGGLIRSHYREDGVLGDDGTIENEILSFEPERNIAFRIHKTPRGFPFGEAYRGTWSVVTLTDLGDGRTHLRLAGMGYTAEKLSQDMRRFFEKGNAWTLEQLRAHFETVSSSRPEGSAHAGSPLSPLESTALVEGARAEVYKAYTTKAGWKAFFGVEANVEARPGGPFELYFQPDARPGERGSEGCTVLSLIPGEMFSHTWNAPPKFPGLRKQRTWVVVTFEEVSARRTRVRLRHLGFAEVAAQHPELGEESKAVREYFNAAWPRVLLALRKAFPGPAEDSKQPDPK